MPGVHIRVAGRVQGVGYRVSLAERARLLGLEGWVRNRVDGSVEAAAWGDDDALAGLVAWAWDGPRMARVTEVETRDEPGEPPSAGFRVLGDA